MRQKVTPDVALGSMLHILQDSFSSSHTCRVARKVGDESFAVLADVEDYNDQAEAAHSAKDLYPAWLVKLVSSGERTYANDPVHIGAWLIKAVDDGVSWTDVEAHLRKTIFATDKSEPKKADETCIGRKTGESLKKKQKSPPTIPNSIAQ